MSDLHQFNPGRKSWKMYTKELTSISGDDLTIRPYAGEDLILEVSGNGNILFKEDGITYNLADLSNAASSNVNLTNYDDASFGNVDISGLLTIKEDTQIGNIMPGTATVENIRNFSRDFTDESVGSVITNNSYLFSNVAYSPVLELYVAFDPGNGYYCYSTDSVSWNIANNTVPSESNTTFSYIIWCGGNTNKFVSFFNHFSAKIGYSSNGKDWTTISFNYQIMALAFSPTTNIICLVGADNNNVTAETSDGNTLSFTKQSNIHGVSPNNDNKFWNVCWNSTINCFVGGNFNDGDSNNKTYWYSDPSGENWSSFTTVHNTSGNSETETGTICGLAHSPSLKRTVSVGNRIYYTISEEGYSSPADIIWKRTTNIINATSGWGFLYDVIWIEDIEYFVACGDNLILYSSDGINWDGSHNEISGSPSNYVLNTLNRQLTWNSKSGRLVIATEDTEFIQTHSNYLLSDTINYANIKIIGDLTLDYSGNLYVDGDASFNNNVIVSNNLYTKELTSISGGDLTIRPYSGEDLILEVSGNGNILFKEDGITYNLADLSNAASSNVNLTNYDDASFGNVDISGGIMITVNDVNSQNITLLELKTNTNTPRIKHDFWQNSSGYADYQIYPTSASTTDFKIGGYNSTFETIRLNALNGIEIYSNQSTNTYGNIKGNDASFGNVDISGNLDISNGVINFFASDQQLLGPDTGIIQKVQDLSNNLLTSNNDASLNNVDICGNLNIKSSLAIDNSFGVSGEVLTSQGNLAAPTWTAPTTGYGFNDVGNADTSLGIITVGNKQVLLNEASEIARAGIANGRSPIAAMSDIPVIPAIPSQAYHCVTIDQYYNQGGLRNMSGFSNRITPVNITSNQYQPFIIPQDGAGVYLIGYGVHIGTPRAFYVYMNCMINGSTGNQERMFLLQDNGYQYYNVPVSRTFVEYLSGGQYLEFHTQVQGSGGQCHYRGMAWITKIG